MIVVMIIIIIVCDGFRKIVITVTQGNLVKQSLGLSKRVHTTNLLASLNIQRPECIINNNILSLCNTIFRVTTPLLDLTTFFLSQYVINNLVIPGTIVSDIIHMGMSPKSCSVTKQRINSSNIENGVVDSIRSLVYHENFIKPYGDEHFLVNSLTKSF